MFRYHDHDVLDEEFDCGGFDDILALAAEGKSIMPDEPYGEYSTDHVSMWSARVAREMEEEDREAARAAEWRKQWVASWYNQDKVDLERERQEALERRQRRAKELEERTLRDWEKIIAAHNAWLNSW